jgi:outer membrane receptor protein involved in Fe transport
MPAARFEGIRVMRSTSRLALAALVLIGGVPALAQEPAEGQPVPAPAPAAAQQPEEIVVTGSRIKRTDLVANSPVSVVDAEELSLTQTLNVEDVIREMPQAVPGITPGVNNGNPGVATVNLRNLDDERTLVLVNGKRYIGYDSEGIVDLNNIPASLIDRVDIVTGGQSAVYGSDAIAGVVNFILKDDFEGVQLDFDYNNALRGGESTKSLSATMGGNFGGERGNATIFAGWTNREPVSQGDRAFSERAITTATGTAGGSSTDTNGNWLCVPGCQDPGNFGPQTFVGFSSANGDLIPRGARRFNFNPFNYLQVPEDRYQVTGLVHYDLAEWATIYGEVHYAQTQVDTQIAPSGTFFSTFEVQADSIYLTPQARDVLFDRDGDGVIDPSFDVDSSGTYTPGDFASISYGRRTIEVGPRITRNRTQSYQILGGLRGDLPMLEGWSYDFSFQHGRTELSRVFQNDIAGARVQDVLDASSPTINPGATDGGTCHAEAAAGCVVGSLFGDGSLSSETASFIALQINEEIYTTMDVAHLDFAGELGETFKIPGASPIGLAIGAEWRRQESDSFPDDCYVTPDCSIGFGSTTAVRGDFTVKEFFGEVRVPLVEDRTFFESLVFEAAYRYADYSTAGGVNAWKVGGEWAPGEFLEGLRLRVNYQEAVRAPNIAELFQPLTQTLDNANGDPCAGFAEQNGGTPLPVPQATRDACVATGAPAAAFTPDAGNPGFFITTVPDVIAGQINVRSGGNPDLDEEQSQTLTIGGVYQPSWLEGLTFTIDWYRVEIDHAISSLNAQTVLDACYGFDQLCNLIDRNDLNGGLVGGPEGAIITIEQNIASLEVAGIDFAVDYDLDLGNAGNMSIGMLATWVDKYRFKTDPISPVNKCEGKYGVVCDGVDDGGGPNPTVRFSQRTTWYIGDFNLGYRWRFINDVEIDDPSACIPRFCSNNETHYVDFVLGWTPTAVEWLQGFEFQVGLENAFDEDPPIVGQEAGTTTANSGNTYPGMYDSVGRVLQLSLTKKF